MWAHLLKESRIIRLRIKKNGTCSALRLWSRLVRIRGNLEGTQRSRHRNRKGLDEKPRLQPPPLPKRTSRCRGGTAGQIRRLPRTIGVQYWVGTAWKLRSLWEAQAKKLLRCSFYQIYFCHLWFVRPKNMHFYSWDFNEFQLYCSMLKTQKPPTSPLNRVNESPWLPVRQGDRMAQKRETQWRYLVNSRQWSNNYFH